MKYDGMDWQEKLSFWNILMWEGLTKEGIHLAIEYLHTINGDNDKGKPNRAIVSMRNEHDINRYLDPLAG